MDRDKLIEMMQKAGFNITLYSKDGKTWRQEVWGGPSQTRMMLDFAYQVAAAEREACALAIKDLRDDHCEGTGGECSTEGPGCDFVTAWNDAIEAIRARGDA